MKTNLWAKVLLSALLTLLVSATASASVKRTGEWPEGEKVTLSLTATPRAGAVRLLAEKAGWSLVAHDLGTRPISIEVHDAPAAKVLEMLFPDGEFVAERSENLVSIHEIEKAEAKPAPVPEKSVPTPPKHEPKKKGEDIVVTESIHIGPGEVVRDVIVWGGSVVVEGTVTGSIGVFGGTATLKKTAYVREDVVAFGGTLDIDTGAQVDGDVAAIFATLRRGDEVVVNCANCMEKEKNPWARFFDNFFSHLTAASLLWLLGALAIALGANRVEKLRLAIEHRPLRNFGLGVATIVALLLLLATLVVTLVGIPLAIIGAVSAVVLTYVGFCVVLLAIGRRILGERSKNPYVHLALGCFLLFLVLFLPVGGFIGFLAAVAALGALVASRGTGIFGRKLQENQVD